MKSPKHPSNGKHKEYKNKNVDNKMTGMEIQNTEHEYITNLKSRLFSNDGTLIELYFEHFECIHVKQIEIICEGLEYNSIVTYVNLNYSFVGNDKGSISLGSVLSNNSTLNQLHLQETGIGNNGIAHISKGLSTNKSLTLLDLTGNEITDIGATELANVLNTNMILHDLRLAENSICNKGAIAFADCIRVNNSLHTLLLTGNNITNVGANSLKESVKSNAVLTFLDLRMNEIDNEIVKEIHANTR